MSVNFLLLSMSELRLLRGAVTKKNAMTMLSKPPRRDKGCDKPSSREEYKYSASTGYRVNRAHPKKLGRRDKDCTLELHQAAKKEK